LRSTFRFSFSGVPNALNLALNLLTLLEVALVSISLRVMVHFSLRNSPSSLRLVCCARGGVVLYRSQGRPPNPPSLLRSATPLRLAFLCAQACCVHRIRRSPPELFLSPSLSLYYSLTCQHSALCMRLRIVLPYPKIHRHVTLRACGTYRAAA
jgi:hypothetical protein